MDKYALIGLIVVVIIVVGIGSSGLQEDYMFINSENGTNDVTQNINASKDNGTNKTSETTNQSVSEEPTSSYNYLTWLE